MMITYSFSHKLKVHHGNEIYDSSLSTPLKCCFQSWPLWFSWLEHPPGHGNLMGSILDRGITQVAHVIPCQDGCGRQLIMFHFHVHVSLSLPLSFFSEINKMCFKIFIKMMEFSKIGI